MRYKIEILKAERDKSVDIPEGCMPVKYDCSVERRYPSVSLVILRPIENIEDKEYIEDKKIEEKCFFCEENFTIDKIGIRPICPICLGKLYGLARESRQLPPPAYR